MTTPTDLSETSLEELMQRLMDSQLMSNPTHVIVPPEAVDWLRHQGHIRSQEISDSDLIQAIVDAKDKSGE